MLCQLQDVLQRQVIFFRGIVRMRANRAAYVIMSFSDFAQCIELAHSGVDGDKSTNATIPRPLQNGIALVHRSRGNQGGNGYRSAFRPPLLSYPARSSLAGRWGIFFHIARERPALAPATVLLPPAKSPRHQKRVVFGHGQQVQAKLHRMHRHIGLNENTDLP
jgi:hypothetical protein